MNLNVNIVKMPTSNPWFVKKHFWNDVDDTTNDDHQEVDDGHKVDESQKADEQKIDKSQKVNDQKVDDGQKANDQKIDDGQKANDQKIDDGQKANDQKVDCTIPISSFDEMSLSIKLLKGIYAYGFEKPSPIQQRSIMPIKLGYDVIAQSQSGTGKTGAFTIAPWVVSKIMTNPKNVRTLSRAMRTNQGSRQFAAISAQLINMIHGIYDDNPEEFLKNEEKP